MRRTGKTYFGFQKLRELEEAGVPRSQIIMNFEDERLLPFTTEDFQWIPDVFFRLFPDSRHTAVHW